MLRSMITLLLAAVLGYGLYLGLLFTQQRSMMFPGIGAAGALPQALPAGAERVGLDASFGAVEAVWLRAPDAAMPAPAVIYFHGNAETVSHNIGPLGALAGAGMHVLLLEYPGYAGNPGAPGRDTLMEVARLGHDWLDGQPGVDPQRIIAMGRSVGSGPATELAAERDLAGLVLLSPFTSVQAFARRFGAPGLLVRDRFDNLTLVRAFHAPVLVFHGESDGIIPFAHGRTLADQAPDGELVALPCGHNDCPYFDADFVERLQRFVDGVAAADAR